MYGGSFSLGRLMGVPLRVHVTWPLASAFVTFGMSVLYFPRHSGHWSPVLCWGLGASSCLLLYASLLGHEFAHTVAARRQRLVVDDITLFCFGGVTQIRHEPITPRDELALAFAGPLASLSLGLFCSLLWWLTLPLSPALSALLSYAAGLNLALMTFNLLPGLPLDGGRVVRALLWAASRRLDWATRWAGRLGLLVAACLFTLGVCWGVVWSPPKGVWVCLVGLFLAWTARSRSLALQT